MAATFKQQTENLLFFVTKSFKNFETEFEKRIGSEKHNLRYEKTPWRKLSVQYFEGCSVQWGDTTSTVEEISAVVEVSLHSAEFPYRTK